MQHNIWFYGALIFLSFMPIDLKAQYIQVSGTVVDEAGLILSAANIYFSNEYGAYSDEKGRFDFEIPTSLCREAGIIQIIASFIGYENDTIQIDFDQQKKIKLDFQLSLSSYVLEPIVVSDAAINHYRNEREFVIDFEFFEGGIAVLSKEANVYKVHILDEYGELANSIDLPFQAGQLKTSCLGDLHAIGELKGVQLHRGGLSWRVVDVYDTERFEKNILPCLYQTKVGDVVFASFRDFSQRINYDLFSENGASLWSHTVYDKEQTENVYREYYKLISYALMIKEFPVENMINYGFEVENDPTEISDNPDLLDLALDNRSMRAVSYFKNITAKPVYAPLFIQRGELVIFDHLNNHLHAYKLPRLKEHRSVDIDYVTNGRFSNRIIQDQGNEKIYAILFEGKNIKLNEINVVTGDILRTHVLPTKLFFESKFKLKNGELYYLAQPDSNRPFQWIYRQRL